jgi:hypothetical protein
MFENIINKKFGRWMVKAAEKREPKSGSILYTCQCDCGKINILEETNL